MQGWKQFFDEGQFPDERKIVVARRCVISRATSEPRIVHIGVGLFRRVYFFGRDSGGTKPLAR
jgi:hypothetical protein